MVKWNSRNHAKSSSNKNSSSKICSHKGCDETIEVRVKFKNPMEVIKYCRRHGEWHHQTNEKSKWLKSANNP
jgi:hypothetical protein